MATTVRPYLRADARREQLLDAAARLFVRHGYAGMTMAAVAREAGVSRRLLYDHFPDAATLYEAFFDDRSSRYLASIDEALALHEADPLRAFERAFRLLLDIPPDDQRAVRLLLADPGLADLASLRARFRAHVERRWLGRFDVGEPDEIARARLWTLVSGLLALAELVSSGEISRRRASALATSIVAQVASTPSVQSSAS